MAKGLYIGVDGKARKVKKIYVGVGDKARKVKKAYIGVNGVARVFYKPELVYNGKASTTLPLAFSDMASATVGNYALFGGGYYRYNSDETMYPLANVYAVSNSLTVSTRTALTTRLVNHTATSTSTHAIFGGGWDTTQSSSSNYYKDYIDAYNTSLTKTNKTGLYKADRLSSVSINNYALFGGGELSASPVTTVKSVNTTLTIESRTALSQARYDIATASTGNYALFAGGYYNGTRYLVVDTYNTSLTKGTATNLTNPCQNAGLGIGNLAIFMDTQNKTSTADVFNASLTKSSITFPNEKVSSAVSVGNSDYGVFVGGHRKNGNNKVQADTNAYVLDTSLTITVLPINLEIYSAGSASVGDYLLFAGGKGGGGSGDYRNTIYTFSMG